MRIGVMWRATLPMVIAVSAQHGYDERVIWSVEVFAYRGRHTKKAEAFYRQKAKHRHRKKHAV